MKLTPISALMLKWAKSTLTPEIYDQYIDHIDTTSGEELTRYIETVCDWYDEVIINKKHFIDNCIHKELSENSEEHLIIYLAAGEVPYSIDILRENNDKVNRIIEIDKEGMEEKQELYDRFFPEYSQKIKCISADITSKTILSVVSNLIEEYYKEMPCIVLLDNATYFLTISDIKNIIGSFKSTGRKNTLILDSLKPFSSVCSERRQIPETLFNKFVQEKRITTLLSFDQTTLRGMIEEVGGKLKSTSDLNLVEKSRMGKNQYFKTSDAGWLEFSSWKI